MNNKQRKNRLNRIREHEKRRTCPECGLLGPHWIEIGPDSFSSLQPGFWTCPKFYGPDGRRTITQGE